MSTENVPTSLLMIVIGVFLVIFHVTIGTLILMIRDKDLNYDSLWKKGGLWRVVVEWERRTARPTVLLGGLLLILFGVLYLLGRIPAK